MSATNETDSPPRLSAATAALLEEFLSENADTQRTENASVDFPEDWNLSQVRTIHLCSPPRSHALLVSAAGRPLALSAPGQSLAQPGLGQSQGCSAHAYVMLPGSTEVPGSAEWMTCRFSALVSCASPAAGVVARASLLGHVCRLRSHARPVLVQRSQIVHSETSHDLVVAE